MLGVVPLTRLLPFMAGVALLAACSETKFASMAYKEVAGPSTSGAPAGRGIYKVGDPYQIKGVWYYPAEDYSYDETGIASWYGPNFHGKFTANGEVYDQNDVTAAHRTLPLPSVVRVTNLENGRTLVVRINDRGPYVNNRILDLSRRSAQLLGVIDNGTAKVRVQIMAEESRTLALQIKGQQPPEVVAAAKVPLASVQAETLPAPGSRDKPMAIAKASAPPTEAVQQVPVADAAQLAHQKVQVVPVKTTQIFIQAGAFQQFEHAHRLSALLSPFGQTSVTQVDTKAGVLFRVRLGPIATVDAADAMLDRVIASGHPEARIVVD
jgi:rare lipoprotein A